MSYKKVIQLFEEKSFDYKPKEALQALIDGLRQFPDKDELLQLLIEYCEDSNIKNKFAFHFIHQLIDLQQVVVSKTMKEKLCVLAANLNMVAFGGSQYAWEILTKGLTYIDPYSELILTQIEQLDEPEHIEFSDVLETIAKKVVQQAYPKDAFEYLLLIFPGESGDSELAKKIAAR